MNTQNFQSLHNVGSVVQHSEGVSWRSHLLSNPRMARGQESTAGSLLLSESGCSGTGPLHLLFSLPGELFLPYVHPSFCTNDTWERPLQPPCISTPALLPIPVSIVSWRALHFHIPCSAVLVIALPCMNGPQLVYPLPYQGTFWLLLILY